MQPAAVRPPAVPQFAPQPAVRQQVIYTQRVSADGHVSGLTTENPTPGRATRAGLRLGQRRSAKPVLAGPGVKSVGEPPLTSSQVVGPVGGPRPNCHRKEDDHAALDYQV